MVIKIRCKCDKVIRVGVQHADKRLACPNCRRPFRVPREKFESAARRRSAQSTSPAAANTPRRDRSASRPTTPRDVSPKRTDPQPSELQLSEMTILPDAQAQQHRSSVAPVAHRMPEITCPSCGRHYPGNAKICVACGVNLKTGRSLITANEGDTDRLYYNAERIIRAISWVIGIGVYPIGSEAYGSKKPYAIFSIVAITILVSSIFLAMDITRSPKMHSMKQLMLWPPNPTPNADVILYFDQTTSYGDSAAFDAKYKELEAASKPATTTRPAPSNASSPPLPAFFFPKDYQDDIVIKTAEALPVSKRPIGEFRLYQLLTNALLHSDIIFHLGGNMFFLVIFGTRVNALIGNKLTAIVYPLLAIGASTIFIIAELGGLPVPCVGASGAIMGLAGMYLVLFPVHKMHMAAWIRWGLFMGFRLSMKIWTVRGFWVVLFYIAFDVFATIIGAEDGVAHWAHLGGFMVGIAVALLLLVTRQVNAHGGDLISVLLGRHAWKLIGKPKTAGPDLAPAARPADA